MYSPTTTWTLKSVEQFFQRVCVTEHWGAAEHWCAARTVEVCLATYYSLYIFCFTTNVHHLNFWITISPHPGSPSHIYNGYWRALSQGMKSAWSWQITFILCRCIQCVATLHLNGVLLRNIVNFTFTIYEYSKWFAYCSISKAGSVPFQPFFTERVFQIFDKDNSGSVSLQEFIDAMHQFAGQSPDDKIRFLFKVYDLDGRF